ncbi:tRNA lysidine(34) synthetase TilS [Isoptericola sp. BMS4]|uniref:tRNA lysidine(34) synthetase TilS n=1 Tax=Isoptericola sp. BMS4 TaxID=2527875 RepID=UPI00141FF405|nr:tRNA lysidine(34) synthetase TilS [Isoptericola sp. BMS4]
MAQVDPALAAARGAVRAELADLADGGLAPGGLVLVACSGGADSLALAGATALEAGRVGRSVRSRGFAVRAGAVVVDHGLQPGSDDVAAEAARQCRTLGLDPVVVRTVAVDDGPGAGGLEAAAREARYAALAEEAAARDAAAVLLGHTLDDQAESVLLGLARGSGARSLAGMPRRRGPLRRPFLGLRRAQTEAVCAALGLEFWTDPTNLLPATDAEHAVAPGFTAEEPDQPHVRHVPGRTRVRGAVLPVLEASLGPGVVEALARSADQLRDDADLLDELASEVLASATAQDPAASRGELVLDAGVLAAAHPALRRRALRAAALAAGCPAGATTARHVDALDALVVSWRGQGPVHLPGDARARRACGSLFLHPPLTAAGTPQHFPRPEE